MEQTQNNLTPEAATDEPASVLNPAGRPGFDGALIQDGIAETFPPGARQPRHDGWTPAAIGGFLESLAANGIVEHAARAVGLSAASAYAFRNRRQGRAFARMWDAVLVHRSRARLAAENQALATLGCISRRYGRDGEVIGEYHYRDNRLAMAMLTRLDRLAEREAPNDDHLRALSENLDGFIACAAEGGDLDAFVEARRPGPDGKPRSPWPKADAELVTFATLAGCADLLDEDPGTLFLFDLDPTDTGKWESEQWVRAFRSGFMTWLDLCKERDPDRCPGRGEPFRFRFMMDAVGAADALYGDDRAGAPAPDEIDTADLDPACIEDWTDEQLARADRSGMIDALDDAIWNGVADRYRQSRLRKPASWQASTSSTYFAPEAPPGLSPEEDESCNRHARRARAAGSRRRARGGRGAASPSRP